MPSLPALTSARMSRSEISTREAYSRTAAIVNCRLVLATTGRPMRESSLIRQQLEDAVAELGSAAREVFDDITAQGDYREPDVSGDFNALTPEDKTKVRAALDLGPSSGRRFSLQCSCRTTR